MGTALAGRPLAILAGGGALPALVAEAAAKGGRAPILFAIAGEADTERPPACPVHPIRWGEIGRLFRLLHELECRDAVLIGRISRRPDFRTLRPDFAAVKLIPRILQIMREGDDSLLRGVARIFEENGVRVVSPLDVAPDLALPVGVIAGHADDDALTQAATAAAAARAIGARDLGQAAVAVDGRVVAVEDAQGTDALLARVAALRESGEIAASGGVLVKCMKPHQDPRLDIPTIGPETAVAAQPAGLAGVAGEAGRTVLAGRGKTAEAFERAGLFLVGLKQPDRANLA